MASIESLAKRVSDLEAEVSALRDALSGRDRSQRVSLVELASRLEGRRVGGNEIRQRGRELRERRNVESALGA